MKLVIDLNNVIPSQGYFHTPGSCRSGFLCSHVIFSSAFDNGCVCAIFIPGF